MAELSLLSYKPGNSYLHRIDIRCKIGLLLLINIVGLQSSVWGLLTTTLLLSAVFLHLRLSLVTILFQTRLFYLLLLFVFISRAVYIPGESLITLFQISVSREGVLSASVYCWRLIVVLFTGIIFISTSRSADIKAGIAWFFKPVPLIPEKRVAVMISLMIRFLPIILEQAKEISEAQKARAVERIKNPVKRLVIFTVPLMRKTFEAADRYIIAMEARCYSEDRTDPDMELKRQDGILILIAVPVVIGLLLV
ncbi:energy-coupling factor transporter transmembrane protein EcfT [bacterium]|nr:energy-coupling factor transporter transmembrane protein EcfT [bacterium]